MQKYSPRLNDDVIRTRLRGLLKTTIASVEATMNHVDIKPNHAPMNSCSIVRPLERSSTNASKAKDCAWHICLPTHICLHGLLETIMASPRLSVEATMNHQAKSCTNEFMLLCLGVGRVFAEALKKAAW